MSALGTILSTALTFERMFTATASATVGNTTTETSILGTGSGTKTLAANFGTTGGSVFILLRGTMYTAAVPGTINFKLKKGSTIICQTGGYTPSAGNSNTPWELLIPMTFRTSTTIESDSMFIYRDASTQLMAGVGLQTSGSPTTVGTSAEALDVTVTWQTADVSNSIACHQAYILLL